MKYFLFALSLIVLCSCKKKTGGCNDQKAINFEHFADYDDGSCVYLNGCTDPNALNYDPRAAIDNGTCQYPIPGCMDSLADNYNSNATIDNGSCIYSGCTNMCASNYNSLATEDNGTCIDKKDRWAGSYEIDESCAFSLSNSCILEKPLNASLCDSLVLFSNLFSNNSNNTYDTAYVINDQINFPWQSYTTNVGTNSMFMGSGTIDFSSTPAEISVEFTHEVAFGQTLNCSAVLKLQ